VMLVRPIKLRDKHNFDDLASSYLNISHTDSCINKSRFDLAADLIAKSQNMRKMHTLKVKQLSPTFKQGKSSHISALVDAQIATTFSDIEDEGPSLPGFSNRMLISVTRSKPRIKVTEMPGNLKIDSPKSPPRHTPSSPFRKSPLKQNGNTTKIKRLKQALMQRLPTPKEKRPQSSKHTRPDNYFLQKPRRRLSLKTPGGAYWLARRMSEGASELGATNRIFDIDQVIRVTSGIMW